ncbi:MAG TPA: MBL fold metallo-hydrolase [Phycisphaerales bacterium]|nr:MBL fold metallo-hydrolase [Phycisphaerales bacterium]
MTVVAPDRPGLRAELCVLASGSGGNCSVLAVEQGGTRRVCLIDLGLSPRRTELLLAERGLGLHDVDDAILTHLDDDHFHRGWVRALPRHATLRVHARHAALDDCFGLFGRLPCQFEAGFVLRCGAGVRALLAAHDRAGVSALRVDFAGPPACALGFATDLGRVTDPLVGLLAGVDVLAIESNYCPKMQEESGRPWFLRRRITGGAGHLSNLEALEAILRIGPGEHVVLLHLSRQCNCPELVASLHEGADYAVTITSQTHPTRWVRIGQRHEVLREPVRDADRVPEESHAAPAEGELVGSGVPVLRSPDA